MRRAVSRILLAAGLAATAAACGGSDQTTTPNPTTPTPVSVTESFAGDLVPKATTIHRFTASTGVVTATLTTLSPLSTAAIGMSLGVWDGTNCSSIAQNDVVRVGSTVVGTATVTSVALCLRVYDIGNIPADATYAYTAVVEHF